jgi:hypothetical protein
MKLLLLSTTCALVSASFFLTSLSYGQDEETDDKNPPAEKPESKKKSAEEAEADEKAEMKKEAETIREKLSVFKALEGEWIGEEVISYNAELRNDGKTEVRWKDEWKGFYTNEDRYFEMTGKTKGDVDSTYHWYVTYDTENEEYRAWSFGSNGWGEYKGQLADDGKAVTWEKRREGEQVDIEDTFELRATGDKCKASGETKIVSKDGSISRNYATQKSSYTRKKIEI